MFKCLSLLKPDTSKLKSQLDNFTQPLIDEIKSAASNLTKEHNVTLLILGGFIAILSMFTIDSSFSDTGYKKLWNDVSTSSNKNVYIFTEDKYKLGFYDVKSYTIKDDTVYFITNTGKRISSANYKIIEK